MWSLFKNMTDTVVLGLGNPLLSDEGIGVFLLEQLKKHYECDKIELHDMGTAGISVLHVIAHKQKAVIIDCAFMKEKPGTIKRFTKEQVRSLKLLHGLSLHEGDLLSTIMLSESLGECPESLVLFGIEPASVAVGGELSQALLKRVDEYLSLIAAELKLTPKKRSRDVLKENSQSDYA
jgi:hydrogenase maturation protease